MPLILINSKDVGEELSRELEYHIRRGARPYGIEVSPEAMESMRLRVKAPANAVLAEHDGVPVRVNRKMIGANAWRVLWTGGALPREAQVDAIRKAW